MKLKMFLSTAKAALKVKAPEIKMVAAAVGVVGGVVWACKATLSARLIVAEYEDDKAEFEASGASRGVPEGSMAKRNLRLIRDLGLCYVGPAATIAGSMYLGFSGFSDMKTRCISATAMAAKFKDELDHYRVRVANKIGADAEADLYHGVEYKDIHVESDGGKDELLKKAPVMDSTPYGPMTVIFGKRDPNKKLGSVYFDEHRNDRNLLFLKNAQINANMALANKHIMTVYELLNDYLGMDVQSLPEVIRENAFTWGWRYTVDDSDSTSDNYIDFGVWDAYWRLKNEDADDFARFFAKDIFLDLNAVPLFYIDHTKEDKLPLVVNA